MAKLSNWKSLSSTHRFETGFASCPVIFAGLTKPADVDLDAVMNSELNAGWPGPVVARSTAKREKTDKIWLGPKGLAFGDAMPLAIGGVDLSWMHTCFIPKPIGARLGAYRKEDHPDWNFSQYSNETEWDRFVLHNLSSGWVADIESVSAYCKELTGIDNLVVNRFITEVQPNNYFYHLSQAQAMLTGALAGRTPDELVVVAWAGAEWIDPKTEKYSVSVFPSKFVIAYCQTPPGMKGVKGLVFNCADPTNYIDGMDPERLFTYCAIVDWDQGWRRIIEEQPWAASTVHFWTPNRPNDYSAEYVPSDNYGFGAVNCVKSIGPDGTPATARAFGGVSQELSGGLANLGIERYTVWRYGQPEFVDQVEFLFDMPTGPDVANTFKPVSSRGLVSVTWNMDRLVEMQPDMKPEDKVKIAGKVVRTVVSETYKPPTVKLDDLRGYSDLIEGDPGLASKVFVPGRDDLPAVTFSEAVSRANSSDCRIFHAMLSTEGFVDVVPMKVVVRKVDLAQVPSVYGPKGVLLSTSSDDAVDAIAAGCRVVFEQPDIGDPYLNAFGMSLQQIRRGSAMRVLASDFNERKQFTRCLPILEDLPLHVRTAQLMVQHSQNRKSMSSFVLGGLMMGNNARKVLF